MEKLKKQKKTAKHVWFFRYNVTFAAKRVYIYSLGDKNRINIAQIRCRKRMRDTKMTDP